MLLLALGTSQLTACAQNPDTRVAVVPPTAGQPLPWLDSLLNSSAILRQHQVGMSLAYADSTKPFYGYQETKYFTPASNMKLFSFYTGLHLLGDSLPSLRYFSRRDTLFFQGTGDPTLLHGDVPSRRAYSFLLNRPEKILAYCDIKCVTPFGPGWTWDDYGYYFQPERGHFLSTATPCASTPRRPRPSGRALASGPRPRPRPACGCCRATSRRWWGRPRPTCSRPGSTRTRTYCATPWRTGSTCCLPPKNGSMKRPSSPAAG
ncbi:D-alanyl-D-alanine carboxypeptidase [Hymenobacter sp. 5317J-9]|uniref:D-alanyl-D-alanine carboxypeptidase n=1 Tax=Hymenobacter sp. 5317J-9 TaxID=2932250 RepID=UPI001FD6B2B1|nr:D-alanyl-D-alanine carboxypeptidase [Hymenobacter sp. 5317J-9]UOQ99340.1 D-alanyl-D-alanine carboxypeptidase [Hymenobacter sp. 5317J-9]